MKVKYIAVNAAICYHKSTQWFTGKIPPVGVQ